MRLSVAEFPQGSHLMSWDVAHHNVLIRRHAFYSRGIMETSTSKLYCHPSIRNQIVGFATQTRCNYLELPHPCCPLAATRTEGMLDDASIVEWFKNVTTYRD